MVYRTAAIVGVLTLAVVVPQGRSADPSDPDLAPAVSSVVSVANLEETLRVVVESGGFGHVSSRVYFQWLVPDRDAASGSRLVSSVVVKEVSGGFLSVGQPKVDRVADGFRIVLHGTNNRTLERLKFTFIAGSAGDYRAIK